MQIPSEFIREINERTDLVDLIGAHVQLKRSGANNWSGLCPFHSEKTPSFSVQPAKGFYHCFGCDAHGDAIGFLQQHLGLDFIDAVEKLAAQHGMTVPRQGGGGAQKRRRDRISGILKSAMDYYCHQLKHSDAATGYLKQRGMTGEIAKRYKIGYAPNEWDGIIKLLSSQADDLAGAGLVRKKDDGKAYDYFRNRILFPIIDASERVCGFGGRALSDDDQPKYLNSAESDHFAKRRLLYGLPQATKAAKDKKRLIVCEGYMDVVMLAQAGFQESVATMGTAATAEQMKKAARHAPNIYFAYDGDAAGRKGAFRALEGILPALKDGIGVFFLFLPSGEDPDSFIAKNGAAAFEQLLADATPLGDYLAAALLEQSDAASEEGKATGAMAAGAELLRQIDGRDATAWRSKLEQKLERATGIPVSAVQARRTRRRADTPAAVYRMAPESLLFNLLGCLAMLPKAAERLPLDLPLPGGEPDVSIVSGIVNALRWQMDMDDDDDDDAGDIDIPGMLEDKGYTELAAQLRTSVRNRFARAPNIELELQTLIDAFAKKRAGRGRRRAEPR